MTPVSEPGIHDSGYSIVDSVFKRSEMETLAQELSGGSIQRTRAGARHLLAVPAVRDLANDPRLLAVASRFVGPSPVAFRATLFEKSSDSNWLVVWHQDTALPLRARIEDPAWGPWSTKSGVLYAHAPVWALEQVVALRVSLDDSTATNGPLRVLPDTHRGGLYDDAEIERLARVLSAVACVTSVGGVVAMRPLTLHASSKALDQRPRRVLHIEYAPGLELAPGVALLQA